MMDTPATLRKHPILEHPASLPLDAEAHQPIARIGGIPPPHVLCSVTPSTLRSAPNPPSPTLEFTKVDIAYILVCEDENIGCDIFKHHSWAPWWGSKFRNSLFKAFQRQNLFRASELHVGWPKILSMFEHQLWMLGTCQHSSTILWCIDGGPSS